MTEGASSLATADPGRGGGPGRGRELARALAALAWVIGGCALILIVFGGAIATGVDAALGGIHSALGPRFGIPAAVLALAILGILLFRRRFHLGRKRGLVTAMALPSAIAALFALLGIAASTGVADRVAIPAGSVKAQVYLLGSFVVLVQVFGEEALLRGLLQPLLTRAWGGVVGVIATALAFTLIHVIGGWRDGVTLLNITLAGIWFGLLALRTSGLLAPTLAHFGYNWGEEMVIGTTPNPGIGDFGSIFDFDLSGPALLGGSVDGFNASLTLSLVLALLIVPLALMPAHRAQPAPAPHGAA